MSVKCVCNLGWTIGRVSLQSAKKNTMYCNSFSPCKGGKAWCFWIFHKWGQMNNRVNNYGESSITTWLGKMWGYILWKLGTVLKRSGCDSKLFRKQHSGFGNNYRTNVNGTVSSQIAFPWVFSNNRKVLKYNIKTPLWNLYFIFNGTLIDHDNLLTTFN